MRKLQLIKIPATIIIMIFLNSCNYYEPITDEGIQGVKLVNLSGNKAEFIIKLKVNNPNSYAIKVKDYNFDIYLNDNKVGAVSGDDLIKLKSNSSGVYDFPAKIEFGNIFTGATVLLNIFAKNKLKIRAKGNLHVKVWLFTKQIDIDRENTVDLSK